MALFLTRCALVLAAACPHLGAEAIRPEGRVDMVRHGDVDKASLGSLPLHFSAAGGTHPQGPAKVSGKAGASMDSRRPAWGVGFYLLSVTLTVGAVMFLNWSRSFGEQLSIVAYLLSLSMVRIPIKALYMEYGFNFPLFVSAVHSVAGALVAFSIRFWRAACGSSVPDAPNRAGFLLIIVPIALSTALCTGVGNQLLLLCSVAFSEIVNSIQPVLSIPFVLMLGMDFNMRLLPPAALVAASCVVCSLSDVTFTPQGLLLGALNILLRAFKVALQQKVLTGPARARLDPCALLGWASLPAAAFLFAWSMAAEGRAPFLMVWGSQHSTKIVELVLASCVVAVILNLSQLFVINSLGAVGSQVTSQLKMVLTVLGGMLLLGERVIWVEGAGFIGVLIGQCWYSHIDQQPAQKSALEKLPAPVPENPRVAVRPRADARRA